MQLDTSYDPNQVESNQIHLWDTLKCFKADPHSKKEGYCLVIPPPNVTGALHMGHALVNTLQDVLIRYKRMMGYETLWVPGTDHAGIATQTVVEKHLIAQFGKRRNQWSREEFLDHVWEWKKASESRILAQLKNLGCSFDLSMLAFTLDETRSKAVKIAFKKLFDEGLIYQGDYLVNWDPVTQTALADDEVEYEEKLGTLYYIAYPIEGSHETLTIATTRPETLLGDTAVAVNPTDPRYQAFRGKRIKLPLTSRIIPIVEDPMVDPTFGTGAVKITPAHDPNDYACAQRLGLKMINLLNPNGTLNEQAGSFEGLTMEEGRAQVLKALKELKLLVKEEKHPHRVGISYRSKAVIEPYLSKQWFVKMAPFKTLLRQLVDENRVKLIPETYRNTYDHWIDNLRDWCISRQLWWGHRIPVWYHKEDASIKLCEGPEGIPLEVQNHPHLYVQDPDVLDTWFSSALWPFSSLGWPDHKDYIEKFYPNSTLVTGHDILFFWVARMMALGTHVMKQPPFPEVFLHGLIFGKSYFKEDKDGGVTYIMGDDKERFDEGAPLPAGVKFRWEKMSKSKGNVLDPLTIMKTYGTDAVRMALATCASQSRQIDLDKRRFEEYKNFANKLWNGARFIFMNLEEIHKASLKEADDCYELEDRWILTQLSLALKEQTKALDSYNFDKAATSITEFFWDDFCAHYLEIAKPILFGKKGDSTHKKTKQKILLVVFCQVLRALHPFTPFITEALFQKLKEQFSGLEHSKDPLMQDFIEAMKAQALAIAPFPKPCFEDLHSKIEFEGALKILHHIREMRGELQIPPQESLTVFIENPPPHTEHKLAIVEALTKIKEFLFKQPKAGQITATKGVGSMVISVLLPPQLIQKEIDRLIKDQEKLQRDIDILESKLVNIDFIQKAPPALIDKFKSQLVAQQLSLETAKAKLKLYQLTQDSS